jgi:hypothetical protein
MLEGGHGGVSEGSRKRRPVAAVSLTLTAGAELGDEEGDAGRHLVLAQGMEHHGTWKRDLEKGTF